MGSASETLPEVPPGLVATWTFHEAAGLLVLPTAGQCPGGCPALIHGLPAPTDFWRTNASGSGWRADGTTEDQTTLMLDGVDDYLTVVQASVGLSDWSTFTLEVRMRVRPFARGDEGTIASLGDPNAGQGFSFVLDDEGFLGARVPGCGEYFSGTDQRVSTDAWVVVALTVTPDDGARLVLDGQPIGFCATPSVPALGPELPLTIGTRLHSGAPTHSLCADLDRIRVFDRAVPLAELGQAVLSYSTGAGPPAAVDLPCSSTSAGCAAGSPVGFSSLAGISACDVAVSAGDWNAELDAVCAEGWQVCTLADLASVTPSGDLEPFVGEGRYALSQAGCGLSVSPRWTADLATCSAQAPPCAGADQAAPFVVEAGFGNHECTSHAFTCGARRCRPAASNEMLDGVLCCMIGCPERSF